MASSGKVSVIIPAYNHARYIAQAIESVLNQTYQNFEIIVWDDGSQDETLEIARSFVRKDPRKVFTYQHANRKNLGQEATRNEALKVTNGEFICLLDSDDYWYPKKLELQLKLFAENAEVGLVFGKTHTLLEKKQQLLDLNKTDMFSGNSLFCSLIKGNFISACSVMVRKKALTPFDIRYGAIGEMPVWLKILRKHKAAYVSEPVAVWRVHGSNSGTVRRIQGRRELVDLCQQFLKEKDLTSEELEAVLEAQTQYSYDLAVILAEQRDRVSQLEALELFTKLKSEKTVFFEKNLKQKTDLMCLFLKKFPGFIFVLRGLKKLKLRFQNPQQAALVSWVEN